MTTDDTIDCADCRACCCRLEAVCLTDTGVPARFLTEDAWGQTCMLRLDDGWCAALDRDTLRCRIYAQRPLVCRLFEMGGPDCIDARQDANLAPSD
ncbi:YkgJ family cysteine cluster protein [Marichromatium sp. AB31]|uniref:YkgJ family cysteine cluster protein n=1 Tax=Marichromatium sp. AB31 TaxID=2483362 RepID=UPI000F3D5A40|nr:YkgJ family cysteine cluster protein [Marichromatium sp. AB31]RNE89567.1 YkgJ family cysteine cluster protein [Marichromatium sp. AB31]